jgi:hypothetical protein
MPLTRVPDLHENDKVIEGLAIAEDSTHLRQRGGCRTAATKDKKKPRGTMATTD